MCALGVPRAGEPTVYDIWQTLAINWPAQLKFK